MKLQEDRKSGFRREGNDLHYTHEITLEDALASKPVTMRTLDQRSLIISVDQTITPQLIHTVKGEGMPLATDRSKRGDLFIHFNIVFPTVMKTEYRQQLIAILSR